MNIEFHIDQLILHGFNSGDRHGIAKALEGEVQQLLSQRGLPQSMQQPQVRSDINAGEFSMNKGMRGNRVGQQVAQQLYKGLTQ